LIFRIELCAVLLAFLRFNSLPFVFGSLCIIFFFLVTLLIRHVFTVYTDWVEYLNSLSRRKTLGLIVFLLFLTSFSLVYIYLIIYIEKLPKQPAITAPE